MEEALTFERGESMKEALTFERDEKYESVSCSVMSEGS